MVQLLVQESGGAKQSGGQTELGNFQPRKQTPHAIEEKYKRRSSLFVKDQGVSLTRPSIILQLLTAAVGIVDYVTDAYLASKMYKQGYMAPFLIISVSIVSPYIIAYSSGVQLFLARGFF
eukprot:UN28448